ncbi:hypothetical protein K438DRAFT_631605 [Mycena galopus ATCC 62051]|nr:hypothetical protein K438DRAFT_631605 [Mycena galopus ATCC 62051]
MCVSVYLRLEFDREPAESQVSILPARRSAMNADSQVVDGAFSGAPMPSPDPTQTVRKSVSVDSFAPLARDAAPRPNRGHTASALEDPRRNLIFDRSPTQVQMYNGRKRGTSVSSSLRDEYDSDMERSESFPERYAGMDNVKPIRGGDLPLPPRATTLSTTSSMSSIMTASSTSSTEDGIHIRQQAMRASIPVAAAASSRTGRTRSGSLGVYASHPAKRILINTHVPDLGAPNQDNPLSLLVVGAAKCGKSVVIRKGLKDYGLSEPTTRLFEMESAHFSTHCMPSLLQPPPAPDPPLQTACALVASEMGLKSIRSMS